MHQLLPFPKGSEATIFNVFQYNAWKYKNEEKDNVLFIVYKDSKGIKRVKAYPRPKMEIGFTRPEYEKAWRTIRAYVPLDKVYLEEVEAKKVLQRIAKECENYTDERSRMLMKIYNDSFLTGQYSYRKEMFKWQHTFMSDISVEDSTRIQLALQYNLVSKHIVNKSFLDIESDVYGLTTSQMENKEAPTTAVTIIFDYDVFTNPVLGGGKPQVFTFLLRDHKKYTQQKYFEDHLSEFINQCHKEFDEIKIKRKDKEFIAPNTEADYHIQLFDDEESLTIAVFNLLNTARPDICAVWNIAYDIPQLYGRLEHLGLNPIDIMCDKLFPKTTRFIDFKIDKRPGINIADRKTFIIMSSTTQFIDQMQTYAQIRKGQKDYGSNALDNIAGKELNWGKRKFERGINVMNAPYKDYWNYILYNINDVWAQVLIDRYTNDMITLIIDSNQSACAIENLCKQTRYQKQIYYLNYLRENHIAGNNRNNDYIGGRTDDKADMVREMRIARKQRKLLDSDGDETKDESEIEDTQSEDDTINDYNEYEYLDDDSDPDVIAANQIVDVYSDSPDRPLRLRGALVGNPNLNGMNGIELIDGVQSKHAFRHAVDFDYKALYPLDKFTRSITGPTQIGRLIIPHKISPKQNPLDTPQYIPGAEFVSDYISQDWFNFGNVWFNLPTISETEKLLGLTMEDS